MLSPASAMPRSKVSFAVVSHRGEVMTNPEDFDRDFRFFRPQFLTSTRTWTLVLLGTTSVLLDTPCLVRVGGGFPALTDNSGRESTAGGFRSFCIDWGWKQPLWVITSENFLWFVEISSAIGKVKYLKGDRGPNVAKLNQKFVPVDFLWYLNFVCRGIGRCSMISISNERRSRGEREASRRRSCEHLPMAIRTLPCVFESRVCRMGMPILRLPTILHSVFQLHH